MNPSNTALVLVLVGIFLPVVSAALANRKWSPVLVGCLTAVLAVVSGFVAEATAGGADFHWHDAIVKAVIAAASAVAARLVLWQHPPLDAKLLAFPNTRQASAPSEQLPPEQRAA